MIFREYIGLDLSLQESDRIVFTDDRFEIDEELKLFSCNGMEKISPVETSGLEIEENGIRRADDFLHEQYYTKAYTQASLFFDSDSEAHSKVETLRSLGYTAVVSDETVEPDVEELIATKLSAGVMAFLWIMAIVFVTMFLSLCSSRAMNATRGDVGIMRSMGIPTTVVKISIYVQTLLALIPAALITAGGCIAIYTIPKTNDIFPFLHAGDYVLIVAVMLLIALNLSRKYVAKMFNQSVKKTLRTEKGGSKS